MRYHPKLADWAVPALAGYHCCVRPRPGFTLIEVVIAAFVFAVGVLALEAMAVTAVRTMRRSADLNLAAAVARARLEQLAASRCADLRSGSETIRSVVSTWTIEPTPSAAIRATTQTVSYTLDGTPRADSYRSMFPCSP